MEEKRQFPRIRISSPLRFQIRGRSGYNNTVSDNLSCGGLSFCDSGFIPRTTPVMLELNLHPRVINPIGKICWSTAVPHSDKYRYGISFVEMNPQDKDYLEQYMSWHTTQK